ncbi:hypothetical protein LRR18_10405 [Mangrovimonas sp. AS39]|uniref:hypothetical protein n=1 Tax=Mangrovimonas futianensis TaxID=2895523 RepID=UPI001E2C8047|nr:hypothetical protein [Mangrovimonas futianensis]MCF1191995.1 hypothetical protein [Mangrovimonas futianensis]MCF1195689.1 hypothetical protein [Mangrovimonas futianensis]
MKTIKNILIAIPIGILTLCLIVIALPFFIIASPFLWIREKKFKKEYLEYLQAIDGSNFFCYNNRKKGRQYIEDEVIPNLPEEVEVLFLNGRKIESDKYDTKFLSRAFYGFKNYTRFPQLLKIRNGETIDSSINAELFHCINQDGDKNELYSKIDAFFELKIKTTQQQGTVVKTK